MIIGIAGVAGSGKGTTAEVLIERGYTRGKFAGALKEMFRALLRYRRVGEDEIERMVEGDLKELPHASLNGRTPRHAMQTLGTEWGRDCIETDLWVDTEMDARNGVEKLIFDDVRHDNEEAAIVRRGGIIVKLIGRGGIDSDHSSEEFEPKNPVVIENTGTLDELRSKINTLADDISWAA